MTTWFAEAGKKATPLIAIAAPSLDAALSALPAAVAAFAKSAGFTGKSGEILLVPGATGKLKCALFGLGAGTDPYVFGAAPHALPAGVYEIEGAPEALDPTLIALGWAMGAYVFDRYKPAKREPALLVPPDGADRARAERFGRAVHRVRDMVNTPAADFGPRAMEDAADRFLDDYRANVRVTVGESLKEYGYPLVHAVGRAASEEPRVIEIEWGREDAPVIVVVGKGVAFDTGGLNIKPGDYMRLMKKDMGGAAHAFGLAQLIIESELDCRLHVIIPAVENAVSERAFRPGDILKSRAGLTVEVENTDAEGRLILADALTRACEHDPKLIIDFATLTGAARVALGPELAPYYANDDELAAHLEAAARRNADPIWRMPLWQGYARQVESPIADLKNLGDGPLGGSILAALFLERFVGQRPWVHFDVFAWNPVARPGRPKGGEAQGLRAAFGLVESVLAS